MFEIVLFTASEVSPLVYVLLDFDPEIPNKAPNSYLCFSKLTQIAASVYLIRRENTSRIDCIDSTAFKSLQVPMSKTSAALAET